MALVEDVLKGGDLVTGIAVGAAAVIVWPLIRSLVRPLAKTVIKGGKLYRRASIEGLKREAERLAAQR